MKRIVVLGLLLLSLFALNVALPEATSTAQAYQCLPAGTWYCRRNTDCQGFCGTAGSAVCSQGCCRCAS
jgi:hypothetical protein